MTLPQSKQSTHKGESSVPFPLRHPHSLSLGFKTSLKQRFGNKKRGSRSTNLNLPSVKHLPRGSGTVCMYFAGDKAAGCGSQHSYLQSLPRTEKQSQPLARLLGLRDAGAMPFSRGLRKFAEGWMFFHTGKNWPTSRPSFPPLFIPGQVSPSLLPHGGGDEDAASFLRSHQ